MDFSQSINVLFVLIFECFAFLTSLFTEARGSRRIGAAGVSRRATWVKATPVLFSLLENTFMRVVSSLTLSRPRASPLTSKIVWR